MADALTGSTTVSAVGPARRPADRSVQAAEATGWLWTTVLLTVGGLVIAPLLAPTAAAPPGTALRWLLFLASSGHVASTAWLYCLPQVRAEAKQRRARYLWAPLGLVAGSAVLAAVVPLRWLNWLVLAFFGWQFWHFYKQNLGVVALAASSRHLQTPSRLERRVMIAAAAAGIAELLTHPRLLRLTTESQLSWLAPLVAAVFAGALVAGVVALARRPSASRPSSYCVVYLMSLAFWLPVFLFRSPYAAVAGITIAHGLQYLLLVGLVAAGERRTLNRASNLMAVIIVVLTLGSLLSFASHLHDGTADVRFAYGAFLGMVMAHFVIDAALWRLRDPFPRRLLGTRVPWLVPQSA